MKLLLVLVLALAACSGKKSGTVMTTDTRSGSGEQPGGGGGDGDTGGEPKPGEGSGGRHECKDISGDPLGSCLPAPKGVLEEGELQTVGAIDKGVVRKVVREHFEALRYCYEATLLANPSIAGTVVAKFTIGIDGTVHDVTANGVHPDVEICVAAKVRGFRFPRPDGAKVEVAYPFTFKPS